MKEQKQGCQYNGSHHRQEREVVLREEVRYKGEEKRGTIHTHQRVTVVIMTSSC